MRTVRFHKIQGDWFLDLPEYFNIPTELFEPKVDDLKMVLGMDTFLSNISEEREEISLLMTTQIDEVRKHENIPAFAKHNWEFLTRVDYVKTFEGKYYTGYNSQYVYFTPIMLMLFGTFPQYIYYKIVKNEPTIKVQAQEDGPDF